MVSRFDFLLKQTELFSHFMGPSGKNKSPMKPTAAKTTSKAGAVKKGKEGDNRWSIEPNIILANS